MRISDWSSDVCSSDLAMVAAAAASCVVEHTTPDTGDLATALGLRVTKHRHDEEARRVPDLVPLLLAASDRDPELHKLVMAMIEERRRPVRTVLQLAQLRGEIGRDADLDVAVAVIIGPFVQRRMIDRVEVTDEFAAAVIRYAVDDLRATARSEEHTSELQSLMRISYAVFCLKKKKNTENE